jgi:hypothetical protein
LPTGCTDAATFESILCRIDALIAAVQANVPEPLRTRLRKRLDRARTLVAAARDKNDAGLETAARGRLRGAAGQLRSFGFMVRSLEGRIFLSQGLRSQLSGDSNAIREDVLALRKSL